MRRRLVRAERDGAARVRHRLVVIEVVGGAERLLDGGADGGRLPGRARTGAVRGARLVRRGQQDDDQSGADRTRH